jgi:hypothetical protein
MSILQVANINFEATGNTQFVYNGANTIVVRTGGSNVMTVNATSIKYGGVIDHASANILSQTLTDASTIAWDGSLGVIATVTLGGNRTVGAPSNLKVGTYVLHVIQDSTGGRTLSWNSAFKWPAGQAPALSTGGGKRDMFSFVSDGTNLYGSYIQDVR